MPQPETTKGWQPCREGRERCAVDGVECECEARQREAEEGFATTDTEFVYEHGVGLTIYAHRAAPWLSWDETKELAAWLAERVKAA
jgi:hypothetical protein